MAPEQETSAEAKTEGCRKTGAGCQCEEISEVRLSLATAPTPTHLARIGAFEATELRSLNWRTWATCPFQVGGWAWVAGQAVAVPAQPLATSSRLSLQCSALNY